MNSKIILASASPRRYELLKSLGYDFEVIVKETDEFFDDNLSVYAAIQQVALQKCKAVADNYPDHIVIGADTIVYADGKVLGKPVNDEHAFKILKSLSGKKHEVISAVAVYYDGKYETFYDVSKVYFKILIDEQINEYICTQEGKDKAGAYAIQGIGGQLASHIEGEFDTIVGLPCTKLNKLLKGISK